MSDEGRSNTALALYTLRARRDEAERVVRYYRERDRRAVQAPPQRPASPMACPRAAVMPPTPPYLAAERVRIRAIIAAAPAGAELVRDEAIANGASIDTFDGMLMGWRILAARQAAERRVSLGSISKGGSLDSHSA